MAMAPSLVMIPDPCVRCSCSDSHCPIHSVWHSWQLLGCNYGHRPVCTTPGISHRSRLRCDTSMLSIGDGQAIILNSLPTDHPPILVTVDSSNDSTMVVAEIPPHAMFPGSSSTGDLLDSAFWKWRAVCHCSCDHRGSELWMAVQLLHSQL